MGDCVRTIMDVVGSCLWDSVDSVANLKEMLDFMEAAMELLKERYEDVKRRVEREEQQRMKRTDVVEWLDRVHRMEAKASEILQEVKEEEQKKYVKSSSYKVGKRVSKMLDQVNELITEGRFRAPVNEKPMEKTVGLYLKVEELWRCIEDTDLRIIGLFGLSGVGKTTLLKAINNEFLNRSHGFEAVIWVSVSKQQDLKKIQDEILREFQIPDFKKIESKERKAEKIHIILKDKKFVLLLDDIWKRLDLFELGVLSHDQAMQKGSKVVFTTRTKDVCGLMEAQREFKVKCLTAEEAWDLFRMKVGEDTLNSDPSISKLSEIMAAECKGLPLALVTIGRAMACRKKPEEWEHAISILRNSPSHFPGMNDVLLFLKFSFDELQNTTLKSSFLYCSIFPRDYNIRKEQLIELWLGEGFIDEVVDCYVDEYSGLSYVRKKGEYIIASLKGACLLESGESEEFVTMHPLIRAMALCECGERIEFDVKRGDQSTQAYGSGSWNGKERISLWDDSIEDLPINGTQLPNLLTLISKAPTLTTFPAGFFQLMPALTVLDLSNSFQLCELPAEIGKLFNLQYLNLSETSIIRLPTALSNLTKLRCLLLNCRMLKIQRKMISNFQLLEVFSTTTRFCDEDLLDELEHLQHISEVSIIIYTATSLTRLLCLPKLQRRLKILALYHGPEEVSVSPSLLSRMEHLELNSESLKEFKISPEVGSVQHPYFDNLCRLVINDCWMSDVTWIIYAPRLQHLKLTGSKIMEEVIRDAAGVAETEENADLFSSLATLHLEDLPTLKSICQHALLFPLLMKIKVQQCPNLKKLPFDSNSAKNSLKQIYGERHWWDRLQWVDEAIKQVFSSKFIEYPYERSKNDPMVMHED